MLDKVPYDVYTRDKRPFALSDKRYGSNEPHESGLSAMDGIEKGQQVVVIFRSNLRKDSAWVKLIRDKIGIKRLNMCKKKKKFRIRCHVVESANAVKRLRQNVHVVIERVR